MSEPTPVPLARRAAAEFLGTGLLVTVVIGSGIMAQRLCGGNVGLELLANSTATALGLAVLILILAPVSGAHFNPVVTLADLVLNRERATDTSTGTRRIALRTAAYIAAQIAGGIGGALLANAMFGLRVVSISTHVRSGSPLWLGEVVATAGLILLIFSLGRSGHATAIPASVGAYIGAAYWFTSSTSFANPAVAVARQFSNTFAGIAPSSVTGFVLAELVGAAIGIGLVAGLFPGKRQAPGPNSQPQRQTQPSGASAPASIARSQS